jgi:hypothetical protein
MTQDGQNCDGDDGACVSVGGEGLFRPNSPCLLGTVWSVDTLNASSPGTDTAVLLFVSGLFLIFFGRGSHSAVVGKRLLSFSRTSWIGGSSQSLLGPLLLSGPCVV